MHDESEVLKTFREYIEAFNKKNANEILPFYDYPAFIVDREKAPISLLNKVLAFIIFYIGIQALVRKGFEHSQLDEISVKIVGENLAIVSGKATRFKANDIVLELIGFTYTLRKISKDWKIVVGIIHDPDKIIKL